MRHGRLPPVPAPDPEEDRLRWVCALLHYRLDGGGHLDKIAVSGLTGMFDRRKVARLIEEAEARGWIRFVLDPPADPELGDLLASRCGLRGARVVAAPLSPADLKLVLGGAGARYFRGRLLDHVHAGGRGGTARAPLVLGTAGGETLYRLVEALPVVPDDADDLGRLGETLHRLVEALPERPRRGPGPLSFRIVPVSRSRPPAGNSLHLSGGELASLLAQRLPGAAAADSFRFLTDPAGDDDLAHAIERLHPELPELYRRCDLLLTGVGGPESLSMQRVHDLLGDDPAHGTPIGEILGLPLYGARPSHTVRRPWTAGISFEVLEELSRAEGPVPPDVIAVAGGPTKVEPLLAVLVGAGRGPLVTHLVTDEATARALLARLDPGGRPPRDGIPREARRRWIAGCLAYAGIGGGEDGRHASRDRIQAELEKGGLADARNPNARLTEASRLMDAALAGGPGSQDPCVHLRCAPPATVDLEERLTRVFRIEARVASGGPDGVAVLAAAYLQSEIARRAFLLDLAARRAGVRGGAELRIGVAGGRLLHALACHVAGHDFRAPNSPVVRIYPLVCRPAAETSDTVVADILTQRLRGARSCEIVRRHPTDRDELERIRSLDFVRAFVEEAGDLDVALLGIGTARGRTWSGLPRGIRPAADLCGRPLGPAGEILRFTRPHLLGIELETLGAMFVAAERERWRRARAGPRPAERAQVRALHGLVGVVAGRAKLDAAAAVLRRNWGYGRRHYPRMQAQKPAGLAAADAPLVNVLITDEELASALLARAGRWERDERD